jgi:hypothetical protein
MDQSVPNEAPTNEPTATDAQRPAEPGREVTRTERKPYGRPQLTEHGKIAKTTLTPSGPPSDRGLKEGFESVDARRVLAAVLTLPIERWSYKGEAARHLGPMAQDFAAAFGLGEDDRHIFPLDAGGVALAAIQGLHALVTTQGARLEALERELTGLRRETAALRVELAGHEAEPVA